MVSIVNSSILYKNIYYSFNNTLLICRWSKRLNLSKGLISIIILLRLKDIGLELLINLSNLIVNIISSIRLRLLLICVLLLVVGCKFVPILCLLALLLSVLILIRSKEFLGLYLLKEILQKAKHLIG